jgi:hypothetical protein
MLILNVWLEMAGRIDRLGPGAMDRLFITAVNNPSFSV